MIIMAMINLISNFDLQDRKTMHRSDSIRNDIVHLIEIAACATGNESLNRPELIRQLNELNATEKCLGGKLRVFNSRLFDHFKRKKVS